jgi:SAM-dependent methyltransferase
VPDRSPADTRDEAYTDRLNRLESVWWKRLLDVQRPYRWNLRRLHLGFTLDLGCGLGRNLINLDGDGVGVDHNEASVRTARERGLVAMTPGEFAASEYAVGGRFDSLLLAHVAEHLPGDDAVELLRSYIGYVRPGGRLVVICPQESGYTKDASHVRFLDFDAMASLCRAVGARPERSYSFPFPRPAGKVFPYNEFVVVARTP